MILADSSYFVALADRRDRWHPDALRIKEAVPQEFLVTDLIVSEAVTIVGSRRGGRPARALYEYFVDACRIEFVEERLLAEGMVHHLRYDGRLSVADSVTLAVMARRRMRDLVSFDRDFDRVKGLRRIC